ncbi:UNVERIFIED_CONTAM: hypothetical protein LK11_34685 [Mumia flava]
MSADDALRSYARVLVRSGLLGPDACVAEVAEAAHEDAGRDDAEEVARGLVASERAALAADVASWPARTDYDALVEAFEVLESDGVRVLVGVDDHWAAAAVVRSGESGLEGVVWFTPPDVWHAVEHGMLEVNAWHPDGANVADGDPLCVRVIEAIASAGLAARFDEGRIEVAASWRRRVGE